MVQDWMRQGSWQQLQLGGGGGKCFGMKKKIFGPHQMHRKLLQPFSNGWTIFSSPILCCHVIVLTRIFKVEYPQTFLLPHLWTFKILWPSPSSQKYFTAPSLFQPPTLAIIVDNSLMTIICYIFRFSHPNLMMLQLTLRQHVQMFWTSSREQPGRILTSPTSSTTWRMNKLKTPNITPSMSHDWLL